MVALLVVLMFVFFITADWLVHRSKYRKLMQDTPKDVIMYDTEVGFTMADGGEPIEKDKK